MIKNPKAKGSRNELKAKRELEQQGWLVEKVKNAGKFQKQVDFFGMFDLICIKKGYFKLIQIKTNKKPILTKYEDFAKEHWNINNSFEVWIWKDRKGWRIFRYDFETEKMKELK